MIMLPETNIKRQWYLVYTRSCFSYVHKRCFKYRLNTFQTFMSSISSVRTARFECGCALCVTGNNTLASQCDVKTQLDREDGFSTVQFQSATFYALSFKT